jgi:uncharacterized protein
MPSLHSVQNVSRDHVLADCCSLARTFWARGRGLLGRDGLAPGHALLIFPSSSIHTFFMRFAIDVVFADRHDRVVALREAMPPGVPFAGSRKARYVIELPSGVIAATGTQVGDQLLISPSYTKFG